MTLLSSTRVLTLVDLTVSCSDNFTDFYKINRFLQNQPIFIDISIHN
jgi:hypothetical protein